MNPNENMWFPGPSGAYAGRQGAYAEPVHSLPEEEFIQLVKTRAEEDGEWVIAQGLTGGEPDVMRKMIEWVSEPTNIVQCYEGRLEYGPTVDWVCRELAVASQAIVRGMRG